jgi:hypothetical protein
MRLDITTLIQLKDIARGRATVTPDAPMVVGTKELKTFQKLLDKRVAKAEETLARVRGEASEIIDINQDGYFSMSAADQEARNAKLDAILSADRDYQSLDAAEPRLEKKFATRTRDRDTFNEAVASGGIVDRRDYLRGL